MSNFLTPQPKSIAAVMCEAATSKIGVRESGGENKGKALEPFFLADSYDPNGSKPGDDGYAWCAAFICWVVQEAIKGRAITWQRPTTPGAWAFEEWALKQDRSVMLKKPSASDIQAGDIVVFKHSHIGLAISGPDKSGFVTTVEGNTNENGGREGYGVFRKRRPLTSIRSRIRIYDKPQPGGKR